MLNPVGTRVSKNAKQGGGCYVVIGHINCERCNKIIEQREIQEPSKIQIKNKSYYYEYAMCPSPMLGGCGLYQPNKSTHVNLKEVPNFIK